MIDPASIQIADAAVTAARREARARAVAPVDANTRMAIVASHVNWNSDPLTLRALARDLDAEAGRLEARG